MTNLSKRRKAINEKLDRLKSYAAIEAFKISKEFATAKFLESIDVSIRLGVDARKSDQTVRGSTVLPHGIGKQVRVAVFAQGENAEKALKEGADVVGFEDLAEKIKSGDINFDVVIATPDAMRIVGQLGQILGPRGLMPNPKVGTVATDVELAVRNAKAGQVRYRTDKNGIVHCTIGKQDFSEEALCANLEALLFDLRKLKPATAKGSYFKKIVVSSTMGPGITIDLSSLNL